MPNMNNMESLTDRVSAEMDGFTQDNPMPSGTFLNLAEGTVQTGDLEITLELRTPQQGANEQ